MAVELSTYLLDGVRYVNLDDTQYPSLEFINLFNDQLELNILHFDHLTEIEQRERGMLLPHEQFVPKKYCVSKASSDSSMRL